MIQAEVISSKEIPLTERQWEARVVAAMTKLGYAVPTEGMRMDKAFELIALALEGEAEKASPACT